MRAYGTCDRAGIGGAGIDVPLEPRTIAPAEQRARIERVAAAIAAGETASPPARVAKPAASRRRPVETTPPIPAPEPAPAAAPPDVAPVGPVLCESGCGSLVSAEYIARTGESRHACCRDRQGATGARVAA